MTDWATWQPRVRANLLFIVRENKILLIRKKRGFGAGKINGTLSSHLGLLSINANSTGPWPGGASVASRGSTSFKK